MVLHVPLSFGEELLGGELRKARLEVLAGNRFFVIPAKADLIQRFGVEVQIDALKRGPITAKHHRIRIRD
jgi:hypothetical protein